MKLDPAIVLVVKRIAQEFKKLRKMIASLPSTAGLPGPPGEPGEPGANGAPGANGVDGVTSFNSVPITPSPSGTVHNWNPAGLSAANVIRLTNAELVGASITGITAKNKGDFLFIINVSQYAMQIQFDDAGSLAANRISGGLTYASSQNGPQIIGPGQTAVFIYHVNGGVDQWFFIGNIGEGIWNVRLPPTTTTIGAPGSLACSSKFVRVTSAATTLKGITSLLEPIALGSPFIWNAVTVWNATGASITIDHEDGSTTAANRIATPSGYSLIWPNNTEATFVYDSVATRWRLVNAIPSTSAGGGSTSTEVWASELIPAITNGPSSNTSETATSKIGYDTLDFDQTTEETATVIIRTPVAWTGATFTASVTWTADAGAGGVVWMVAARFLANDDPLDSSFGTEVDSTDTLLATGDLHESPQTAAITPGGVASSSRAVAIRVARKTGNAGDTLTADARLIGLTIYW